MTRDRDQYKLFYTEDDLKDHGTYNYILGFLSGVMLIGFILLIGAWYLGGI